MLQAMREGIGRWVAVVILGLLSVAFIFWGVDFTLTGTPFAAKVNGTDIPILEFERGLPNHFGRQLHLVNRHDLAINLDHDGRIGRKEKVRSLFIDH